MKQLVAAVATLALIVSGLVLVSSRGSSAQENDTPDTTTTVPENDETRDFEGFFDFRFGGEVPAELEELRDCLAEQDIEVPDTVGPGFRFELRGLDEASEALEACGLPELAFPPNGFPFGGELFEDFPFGELPDDFPFGELPEGFPFGGELFEDFPFGELPDDFPFREEGFPFGELPDDFPFGGEFGHRFRGPHSFGFGIGPELLDRDELAGCLAELGSFESVDQVREQLDECLPEHPAGDFGGWFEFDVEPDEAPAEESNA